MGQKKGFKHTDEAKEKIRAYMERPEIKEKMRIVSSRKRKGYSPEVYNKMFSPEYREAMRKRYAKPNNNLLHVVKNHFRYNLWRGEVFTRDSWTCRGCFSKDVKLEAHHKVPLLDIIDKNIEALKKDDFNVPLLFDVNNGVTLCIKCHLLEHGKVLRLKKASLREIITALRVEIAEKDRIIQELPGRSGNGLDVKP